ncbi:MAG: hypothetical protein K6L73_07670 [Cellvibrionaceae bacterium]
MVTDSAEDNITPSASESIDDAAFFEDDIADELSNDHVGIESAVKEQSAHSKFTKKSDPSSVIITADSTDAEGATTWVLPSVGGKKVVPAKNRENRRKKSSSTKQYPQDEISEGSSQESIEEVEDKKSVDEVVGEDVSEDELTEATIQPITAEQLAEMTEAAEREGFLKGQQQGYEKGYAEGKEQGYSEGQRLAEEERVQQQSEFDDLKQRFMALAETLHAPIEEQDNKLELVMLKMVGDLTRKIVQRELQADSSQILTVVQKSLEALPVGAKNITLILNPDDMALVETWAEERGHQWGFRADTEMSPGGCRIQTPQSMVDFSVEKRAEDILQELDSAGIQLNAMEQEDSAFEVVQEAVAQQSQEPAQEQLTQEQLTQEQLTQAQLAQENSTQENSIQEQQTSPVVDDPTLMNENSQEHPDAPESE